MSDTLGTRGFSRLRQEFSLSAEGLHILGHIARSKVSGTQGNGTTAERQTLLWNFQQINHNRFIPSTKSLV